MDNKSPFFNKIFNVFNTLSPFTRAILVIIAANLWIFGLSRLGYIGYAIVFATPFFILGGIITSKNKNPILAFLHEGLVNIGLWLAAMATICIISLIIYITYSALKYIIYITFS